MLRLLLIVTVACLSAATFAQLDPQRPNVLVVLLDDWGVDRMDAYSASSSRTPVLDYVASVGQRYTQAYADPICSPTRAAALTGMLGVHTGVMDAFPWVNFTSNTFVLDPATVETIPELLHSTGYASAAIGKWHLTAPNWQPDPYLHPVEFGFDVHMGPITNLILSLGASYDDYEYNHAFGQQATQMRETTYATTKQVDDAIEWIAHQGDAPWFTWLALNAPHKPWTLPPQDLVSVDLADVVTEEEKYDAVLEAADTEIGRLLVSIRRATLQNTVVIILGDNGTPQSAFSDPSVPQKKGTVAQGGIHVPLIVWHSAVQPTVVEDLVHVVDLHATVLELTGTPPLPMSDSLSFAPLIHGAVQGPRDTVYVTRRKPLGFGPWTNSSTAVLDGDYKLREEGFDRKFYEFQADDLESIVATPLGPVAFAARAKLTAVMNALAP